MDAAHALEEIYKLASSYGFDVSEQIELDRAALCHDHANVAFQGKLCCNKERIMAHTSPLYCPKEITVAVKANFSGLPQCGGFQGSICCCFPCIRLTSS